MLNGLDLFSGIAGISMALSEWVRPIAYCEIDRYAQAVLLSRMSDGRIPTAPIWDDVRTLGRDHFDLPVHIITGGFPCQDISVAGAGAGLDGERSGLYWQVHRLIGELKPRFIFLENVPAITGRGGIEVVESITSLGYDCRWTVLSAASVGAPHKRERWWLLAHSMRQRLEGLERNKDPRQALPKVASFNVPQIPDMANSAFYRTNNELPVPVDRIKALGNAVVPLQARTAFEMLIGFREL